METILNILSLGLYSVLSKRRKAKVTVEKTKYRSDGSLKKTVSRETEFEEDEAPKISQD